MPYLVQHFKCSILVLALYLLYLESSSASVSLLFTTYHDIRLAKILQNSTTVAILTDSLTEGTALDFYYEKQLVCWTDQGTESIQCMKMNDTQADIDSRMNIISKGLDKPEGLAIDWYTDKIYWTDGETNKIEVATLNGKNQKVLFWDQMDQPRAIALVPSRKIMIWTDWGENPKIESASMDGEKKSRKILVNDNIFWPNGITIDLKKEEIYWVDGNLKFLDVMNLDGSNRRTVVKNLEYPYSVTFYQNMLYWTDWQVGSLHYYNVLTGELKELIKTSEYPITVHAWASEIQPSEDNPCRHNNGNCSHLCLLSTNAQGFSCVCPTGIKLISPTTCADGPQDMLFLVQRTQISKISLDSPDFTSFPLPFDKVKYAIAIDYDSVEDFIYWSDEDAHVLRRARQDGTMLQNIVSTEVEHPDGIAIDYLARNLYWTDTGTDKIEVCRLDGSSRKVLIYENLEEPRAIALAPELGWMFFSDWNEKNPKIERASLDASERVVLISENLGWPNGIALDVEERKIYWCDAKLDKIEVMMMDGSDRRVVLNENLPHVFGLSLLGDYLYFTDWQRRSVDRAHKITGEQRIVIVDQFPDLMGIKVTKLREIQGTSRCTVNNGKCSHLCFNRPKDYVCRCPMDLELAKDKHTCLVPEAFLLFSCFDHIGRISITYNDENHIEYIPFKDKKDPQYLDVDIQDKRVYIADKKYRCITRAFLNGSDVQKIIETGIISLDGIAVDYLARNIYFTDSENRRIEVARLDGSSRRVLIWKGIEEPRNLILEPKKGYMYWTEWPSDSIRRAALDGTDLTTIISDANHAIGLTLDPETRKIYWAQDSQPPAIEYSDVDGKNRLTLILSTDMEMPFAPHSLTIFQEFIYWSDWNTGTIEKAHKINGLNRTIVHTNLEYLTSLLVFHPSRQTGSNQCRINNGGCTHLCLALPFRKVICSCPTHYQLDPKDLKSCIAPKNFIIFSQKNSFGRLLPNTNISDNHVDAPDTVLPVFGKNIRAVEFDPIQKFIYWIDSKSIRKSLSNGTKASVFIGAGSQPYDLVIDPIGRLLFWTCSHSNTINITTLDGYGIGYVDTGDSEKPRHLAIHSVQRLLFWTDVEQQSIFRSRLDGSDRMTLAVLEGNSVITIDPLLNLVIFAHSKRIDMMDIHGKNRKSLVSTHINNVNSLAVFQGYVYWIDDKVGVEKISISGENRRPELQKITLTDITAVYDIAENHTCSGRNKCSHICIATDSNSNEICSCPKGLMLVQDRKNCAARPLCGNEHFTCQTASAITSSLNSGTDLNRDCIPISWRCDGTNDCPDKSDETGCPSCAEDQFRCKSGECIDKSLVCDGTTNCADGLDESDLQCCPSNFFQCPGNQVCIPQNLICDGWENCANGEDEDEKLCKAHRRLPSTSNKKTFIIVIIIVIVFIFFVVYIFQIYRTKNSTDASEPKDHAVPLSPCGVNKTRVAKLSVAEAMRISTLNSRNSLPNSYDRNHITGASSSTTNGSSLIGYANPPPSPATTKNASYHNYRTINPPPPTPCSTEAESDSIYSHSEKLKKSKRKYDEYFPPPPTPKSETNSCPPSPSSTNYYFSPFPPPPSPTFS